MTPFYDPEFTLRMAVARHNRQNTRNFWRLWAMTVTCVFMTLCVLGYTLVLSCHATAMIMTRIQLIIDV